MAIETSTLKIKKHEVLCREGAEESDLYFVTNGLLLICSRSGHMVTPLAHIKAGEYFGEMSFFDKLPRSADVIALEDTKLVKISSESLKEQIPTWLLVMAKQMTNKLRIMDTVISDKGIKRTKVKTLKPLSMEEQRFYYQLLSNK